MLNSIRVVLVETSHPGNIGAAARAMKNMGLHELYLVNPAEFPSGQATARAAGADDLLENAVVCDSLEAALADCELVFATSARSRHLSWPSCNPRECAMKIAAQPSKKIVIIFGNEQRGLTNAQLMQAHYHVFIPTADDFSSLNLAAAVQVIAYELRMQHAEMKDFKQETDELATQKEIQGFYEHMQVQMQEVGFLNTAQPRRLLQRLRRLFNRTQLTKTEVNILRGWLNATSSALKRKTC